MEDYINTIREDIYYSGYIVEDKWRPSGWYMETNIYNILPIYIYHNFELNRFIDNNERLTLERRNLFQIYRRIIIHLQRRKHQPNYSRAGVFYLEGIQKSNFFYRKKRNI